MAIEEHKQLIIQGVNQWNMWRRKNHDLRLVPDLSDIDLSNTDLRGANFAFTNLTGARLSYTNLGNANLVQANLSGANLHRSNLVDADLSGANLTGANLTEVIFFGTLLNKTDFTNTLISGTVFANIDFRESKNLIMIKYGEPSSLGIDTVLKSKGTLPIEFLRGVGLSENFINYILSLS